MAPLPLILALFVVILISSIDSVEATSHLRRGMSDREAKKLIAKEAYDAEQARLKNRVVRYHMPTKSEKELKMLEEKKVFSKNGQLMPARKLLDCPLYPGSKTMVKKWITVDKYDALTADIPKPKSKYYKLK